MAILYKGAAPGTHWCVTDARTNHGFYSPPASPVSAAAVVRHITAYSFPSPFVSFSASYAVAYDYAMRGPAGLASATNRGYVYEIDTGLAPVELLDPVQLISAASPPLALVPRLPTHHDGGPDLILAVAAPSLHPSVLTSAPKRAGGGLPQPPAVSPELSAIVFALRDAEVLIERVPAACIVARHAVP